MIGIEKHEKKIGKDMEKIKYWNHQYMDFGLVFLNLIPLRYIYNITLMLIHTKNFLRAAYQFAKFDKKFEH